MTWPSARRPLAAHSAVCALALGLSVAAANATSDLADRLSDEVLLFEQTRIEMPDGVLLSADLYRPRTEEVVPVLLEYLPYRKQEDRAYRWHLYRYFVERGYAVARVDIRGTGSSTGRLPSYEYSEIELDDGERVIAWLTAQPWSNGRAAVFGISWGGFNAIQLGMRAPPGLAAILAACATDDLFYDDVHYIDGLMHIDQYEINQDMANSVVASPELVLDEEALRNRFDTEPWIIQKLRHGRDGPFWDRGSLSTDYSQLRVPAFLIGGYYDGYRDSVPRMLEHAQADTVALVGPWPHSYPHDAVPGPRVEWRDRAVRFFDRHLRGAGDAATGADARRELTFFEREYTPPGKNVTEVPGRWRTTSWPVIDRVKHWRLSDEGRLVPGRTSRGGRVSASLPYRATLGYEVGSWWGDLRRDQDDVDAFSLVFETAPLKEEVRILGFPTVSLEVDVDAEEGKEAWSNWFVRLADVNPRDDSASLVTGAGQHVPAGETKLDVEMHFTSWVFEPGHRIRISISNAQWPMVWPSPVPMTTTVRVGGPSTLALPVAPEGRAPDPPLAAPAPFVPYPIAAPPSRRNLEAGGSAGVAWPGRWQTTHSPQTGVRVTNWEGSTKATFDWSPHWDHVERLHHEEIQYTASDRRPWKAEITARTATRFELVRGGTERALEWVGHFRMRSTKRHFVARYVRELWVDGKLERRKRFTHRQPRAEH